MINAFEISNVLKSSKEKKYKYFINKVVDSGYVFGLFSDGWALTADAQGQLLIPLWPAKEYAILCQSEEWKNYKPERIEIHDFLDEFINSVEEKGISFAIFYTPSDNGILCSNKDLSRDLKKELDRLE